MLRFAYNRVALFSANQNIVLKEICIDDLIIQHCGMALNTILRSFEDNEV
jgi:hypothetical protein